MLFFLALSALAAATFGSVMVYQRGIAGRLPASTRAALPARTASAPPGRPSAEASLESLDVGDIVQDGDLDFVVVGVVRYREEREQWSVVRLDGGGTEQRWLEVRMSGGALEARFFVPVTDAPTFGALGGGLTYRGRPFSLVGRGDARVSVVGETADRRDALLKYVRYASPGGDTLVVEEEGGQKRALFGTAVPPSSLAVLGGELNRARDSEV